MTPPPSHLDGHRVIRYATIRPHISPTGATRHLVDGKFLASVAGLAVCRREGDGGYNLYYCDDDWRILTRSSHSTLEEAIQRADWEDDEIVLHWRSVGG
jgi:hypothetical protein